MVCHGVSPAQEQVSTVDVPRASGQIVTGLGTVGFSVDIVEIIVRFIKTTIYSLYK